MVDLHESPGHLKGAAYPWEEEEGVQTIREGGEIGRNAGGKLHSVLKGFRINRLKTVGF